MKNWALMIALYCPYTDILHMIRRLHNDSRYNTKLSLRVQNWDTVRDFREKIRDDTTRREEISLNRCCTKKWQNSFRPFASFQFSGAESLFNLLVSTVSGTRPSNASSSRSYLTCTKVYRELGKKQPHSSPLRYRSRYILPRMRILSILQSCRHRRRRGTSSWVRGSRTRDAP